MHPFELLYIMSTTVSLIASVPQARQLIITKRSDELSATTWGMWVCTQCVSLFYAISIAQTVLILANIGWLTFYSIMVVLILYYRRPAHLSRLTPVLEEATE